MQPNEINFKQERDFGDLFNATFAFIGAEIKRLGTAILYFAVPLMLVGAILSVFISVEQQQSLQSLQSGAMDMENPFAIYGKIYNGYFFLNLLVPLIIYGLLSCITLGYVKLYVNKGKDNFTLSEVWSEVTKYIVPVIFASLLTAIITAIGAVFCLVPGVYLGVSLSLFVPLIVIEGKGFGDAFNRSFKLVKHKFWMTLGALFVMGIIVYVISMILSIPALILGMKPFFASIMEGKDVNFDFGISFYIISAIISLLTYIVYSIPTILVAFLYYSLVETYEKPSLVDRIDQISDNE
ncbi:glycerophosphoryl diester phosphodiesterase membrane domain-containing protein [Saccharicrinis sp. FJH54]|uniref:glycerophosphoryl diester phosphodiesterase membrane domain-containing protein n=1 Tax=Saccharicrinis sp. FJH54 TaxID=3344665 RepID=UPI0035D4EAAE